MRVKVKKSFATVRFTPSHLLALHEVNHLEPEILEGFGGAPVEPRRLPVVSAALRKVSLCNPRCGLMGAGREL